MSLPCSACSREADRLACVTPRVGCRLEFTCKISVLVRFDALCLHFAGDFLSQEESYVVAQKRIVAKRRPYLHDIAIAIVDLCGVILQSTAAPAHNMMLRSQVRRRDRRFARHNKRAADSKRRRARIIKLAMLFTRLAWPGDACL